MSIDKSLRGGSRLARSRNVLSRYERIAKMKETEKWPSEGRDPFGLPKLRIVKVQTGKKKKKAEEGDDKDKKDKKGAKGKK